MTIAHRWRELTSGRLTSGRVGPGEPTLVACSGGADSSALVIALAAVSRNMMVAHVVHDLRPAAAAYSDRDAVRQLADRLELPFAEAVVSVHDRLIDGQPGVLSHRARDRNAESVARALRYAALARLALREGVAYVATAHHAGDQLETMLMALARGAGPRGLRGVAPSRTLHVDGHAIQLIRPMLTVAREDAERLCREAGWQWREDATNADTTRVRSYFRHTVVPHLKGTFPSIDKKAASAADLLADAAGLVRDRSRVLLKIAKPTDQSGRSLAWPRELLRRERRVVIGDLLRLAADDLGDTAGMDGIGRRSLQPVITTIRSFDHQPKQFQLHTFVITVDVRHVTLERVSTNPTRTP